MSGGREGKCIQVGHFIESWDQRLFPVHSLKPHIGTIREESHSCQPPCPRPPYLPPGSPSGPAPPWPGPPVAAAALPARVLAPFLPFAICQRPYVRFHWSPPPRGGQEGEFSAEQITGHNVAVNTNHAASHKKDSTKGIKS